jgi:hypothetical protein
MQPRSVQNSEQEKIEERGRVLRDEDLRPRSTGEVSATAHQSYDDDRSLTDDFMIPFQAARTALSGTRVSDTRASTHPSISETCVHGEGCVIAPLQNSKDFGFDLGLMQPADNTIITAALSLRATDERHLPESEDALRDCA